MIDTSLSGPGTRAHPSRDLLRHWFDPLTLVRGEALLRTGGVLELRPGTDGSVHGVVRGSHRPRYETRVRLIQNTRGLQLETECSCPVGVDCKHAAALLLRLLALGSGSDRPACVPPLAPVTPAPASGPSPALSAWLERVGHAALPKPAGDAAERLLYLLQPQGDAPDACALRVVSARALKKGGYGKPRNLDPGSVLVPGMYPGRFEDADRALLHELALARDPYARTLGLAGERGAALLARVLASGRCHWLDENGPLLAEGPARPATVQWQTDPGGGTRLAFVAGPPADAVLPLSPPWYVDAQAGCCGPLSTTLPPALAGALASAPVLEAEDIDPLNDWLERHLPGVALPRPPRLQVATEADFRPQPRLRLYSRELGAAPAAGNSRGTRSGTGLVDGVHLDFGYGDAHWLDWHDDTPVISRLRADRVVERIARRRDLERAAIERLYDADLIALRNLSWAAERLPRSCRHDFGFHDPDRWADFVLGELPRLRAEGWRIEIEPGFRYDLAEPGEWFAELDESGGEDWFGLALGVELDGERVNLLPCLVELLARLPGGDARSWLAQLGDERRVMVPLPDGRLLPVPAARIRKILAVLVELYDGEGLNLRGKLSLARSQATRLAELEAALGDRTLTWHGGERLRTLLTELRRGPQPVAVPEGFHAQLRPYQQQGLEWLQFLRVTQLAGVLADDMGLGKTVQTLAHIACEHAAGRLDRPVLIVAPTSLLPNWRDEAARFAPRLRVLALRGPDRARDFARIPEHDLVLTTYALLPRDREALARHTYHLLILDEAQAIKNPTAQAGIVARALRARHRLCLTGTPMENHLGELWSLFDFLLPGLLGDARQFQRSFRKPIEKDGDRERRERLAARVAPFLLRRTKEQVAADLPPKTEIVRTIEIAGPQRDLYEAIRLSMQERVRAEIAAKGLARSHIVILDALLKLRQVCCDPRLVKLGSARAVKGSAKLELLTEMLPELVDEGRRVLVFSQFTQMLALIEKELTRLGIAYVLLTGTTEDRATPVRRFQAGEVPVFLISLKAGGTGLNLTAADTVIHYDPWWNPAAEDQASDRAHRIGQEKPVFVYKLYTEGTVEEKIRDLQVRKRALVESILTERDSAPQLAEDDLDALFAPL